MYSNFLVFGNGDLKVDLNTGTVTSSPGVQGSSYKAFDENFQPWEEIFYNSSVLVDDLEILAISGNLLSFRKSVDFISDRFLRTLGETLSVNNLY